jgi:hypothetical protein
MISGKKEPFNWSNYQRTYNDAIDIVAQCVGHARATGKGLKTIYLKPTYHDLFRQGLKVLRKINGFEPDFDPNAPMYFDGVELKRGSPLQFDSIRCEYYKQPLAN